MSCSKYGLQGLHARLHIPRETNGRLGEYQRFSSTCRPANSFYVMLIAGFIYLPRLRPSDGRRLGQPEVRNSYAFPPPPGMPYDQLDRDDTQKLRQL